VAVLTSTAEVDVENLATSSYNQKIEIIEKVRVVQGLIDRGLK